MINRDYLPYKAAIEYEDRGMAKWMGFFISEHTTALSHLEDMIDFSKQMDDEEILLLLSQIYLNRLEVQMYTSIRIEPFIGEIYDLNNGKIFFRTKTKATDKNKTSDIVEINLSEIIRIVFSDLEGI